MAVWWFKVAEELEALRRRGIERPYGHIPNVFSGKAPPTTIETTHRDITPRPAAAPPALRDEKPFREDARRVDNGASESFLMRGVRKS